MTEDTKGWLIQWADQLQVLQDQMLELAFAQGEAEDEAAKDLVTKAAAALDEVISAIADARSIEP